MLHTFVRNWWLLAICAALYGAYSVLNLIMLNSDGSRALRGFAGIAIPIAAGLCTIAAALWRSARGRSWLLLANGLALAAFGLLTILWSRGRHGFLPVALLFVVMAASLSWLALRVAPGLGRRLADKWSLAAAGLVWLAFAAGFLAFGFGLVRFTQPGSYFIWMSSYFGFTAICMLAAGLRLNHLRRA
jgi:hypothetical protein